MNNSVEIICRKHWFAYVGTTLVLFVGLNLLTNKYFWFAGILLIVICVIKIGSLRSCEWKLSSDSLFITRGILPWRKTKIQIPIFDIYESIVTNGMFGHFFKYGNIIIRRTEGNTTRFEDTCLADVEKLSMQINSLVYEVKKRKYNFAEANTNSSVNNKMNIVEELKRLSELKDKGELTQAEFELLKEKLINQL